MNPRVGKRPRQLAGEKTAGDSPERKGEASPRRSALVLSWPMRPIWRPPPHVERAYWLGEANVCDVVLKPSASRLLPSCLLRPFPNKLKRKIGRGVARLNFLLKPAREESCYYKLINYSQQQTSLPFPMRGGRWPIGIFDRANGPSVSGAGEPNRPEGIPPTCRLG